MKHQVSNDTPDNIRKLVDKFRRTRKLSTKEHQQLGKWFGYHPSMMNRIGTGKNGSVLIKDKNEFVDKLYIETPPGPLSSGMLSTIYPHLNLIHRGLNLDDNKKAWYLFTSQKFYVPLPVNKPSLYKPMEEDKLKLENPMLLEWNNRVIREYNQYNDTKEWIIQDQWARRMWYCFVKYQVSPLKEIFKAMTEYVIPDQSKITKLI